MDVKEATSTLADHVTVVVSTSPVKSDPDLELLHATFASFQLAGMSECRCILVCDYFGVGASRSGEHGGVRPQALIDNYRARIEAFKEAEWAHHVDVLELESWHGFALGIRRALDLVVTPFVCVVQHDVAFKRVVDLCPVVKVMQQNVGRVNFVSLLKTSTEKYRVGFRSRTRLEVGEPVSWSWDGGGETLQLIRLPQFLDSTHLAHVGWYTEQYEKDLLHGAPIGRGQFTEDNLGQYMLQQALLNPRIEGGASVGVLEVVANFGCWLYDDGTGASMVVHLDGRKFMSPEQRVARSISAQDFRYRFAAACIEGTVAQKADELVAQS